MLRIKKSVRCAIGNKDKELCKHSFNLADIVTMLRIVGALSLIAIRPLSALFFLVYAITGVTDVLDGQIARKTNTASEFGARLDSIADMVFYGVTAFKIIPLLWNTLTPLIWGFIAVTALVRTISYVVAMIKYRCFASLHTYMNKLTGFLLFIVPYIVVQPFAITAYMIISVVAVLAASEELIIHVRANQYCADKKTLFMQK